MPRIPIHTRTALAPLLQCARTLGDVDRAAWLAELRRDSPTVVTLIEQLLQTDAPDSVPAQRAATSQVPSTATPLETGATRPAAFLAHTPSNADHANTTTSRWIPALRSFLIKTQAP